LLQLKYFELEIERDQLLDRVQAMAAALEEYRGGLEKWKQIAMASRELLAHITSPSLRGIVIMSSWTRQKNGHCASYRVLKKL
jgi:hypothetical protein